MHSFYCRFSETERRQTLLQLPTPLRNASAVAGAEIRNSETCKLSYQSLRIANPRLPAFWLIFRRHCHWNPESSTSLIHNTLNTFNQIARSTGNLQETHWPCPMTNCTHELQAAVCDRLEYYRSFASSALCASTIRQH